jgi:colicin import membrane protein
MHAIALDDLRPRKPDSLSRGAMFALVAHGLLVLALTLGVSWRTSEPAGIEAELWAAVPQAAVPQAAAPRAVEPEPPKPLPPQPQPKPEPKVEPPPPNRDAEIAREKREQKELLEKQRLEDEKREADKKKREQAEERQRDKQAEAQRLAQLEAQRQENLKRIMGQAGATGAPTDTGTAMQSAGPSASYKGRIMARIRPNIVLTSEIDGNPMATVEVKVAPDGTITARRLVKSSGVAAWDDAVIRAIDKTEVLPRDTDGRVPPSMVIDFRPRDF